MTARRRLLSLLLIGCLAAGLSGCARSSVAIDNPAPRPEGSKKDRPDPAQVAQANEPKAAPAGEGFRFPEDRGGKLLGQMLEPPARLPDEAKAAPAPRPLPPPASVDRPELPVPPSQAALVRPPLQPKPVLLRPHVPAEEAPLSRYQETPAAPVRVDLPAGARVSLPSRDVELPVPLPTLAQPGTDRVPTDDPTASESLKAALATLPPVRATPAPFDRPAVPDPFANAQAVRLKAPPAEEPTPASGTPQPPRQ